MINITTPQRFYQIEFIQYDNEKIFSVIDLKEVIEIALIDRPDRKEITISRKGSQNNFMKISNEKVASEEFSKIVTAWTSYKLATEK